MSFRRQVHVLLKPNVTPPEHINFSYLGTNYRVFLSTDSVRCFSCGEYGHISRACKRRGTDDNDRSEANPLNHSPTFVHNPSKKSDPKHPPKFSKPTGRSDGVGDVDRPGPSGVRNSAGSGGSAGPSGAACATAGGALGCGGASTRGSPRTGAGSGASGARSGGNPVGLPSGAGSSAGAGGSVGPVGPSGPAVSKASGVPKSSMAPASSTASPSPSHPTPSHPTPSHPTLPTPIPRPFPLPPYPFHLQTHKPKTLYVCMGITATSVQIVFRHCCEEEVFSGFRSHRCPNSHSPRDTFSTSETGEEGGGFHDSRYSYHLPSSKFPNLQPIHPGLINERPRRRVGRQSGYRRRGGT